MALLARYKWLLFALAVMGAASGGLLLGKSKEKEYLASLYRRSDFTLLTDQGDFFTLSALPAKSLALLVFTPDGIPVSAVRPFHEFAGHLSDLRKIGIETFLVSRTNREIVRNFKTASRFEAPLLLDTGGTVGRNTGIWEGLAPANYWGYALVNHAYEIFWVERSQVPLDFEELSKTLRELR